MKRITLLFVIVLITGQLSVYAQAKAFGAKVTTLFSWSELSTENDSIYENDGIKLGMGFGPSLKFKVSESFSAEVGILFTWQGTKFTQSNQANGLDYAYKTKLQYVTIPVNFEGKIPIANKMNAIIDFGFIPAIKLSSKMDVTDNSLSLSIDKNKEFPGGIANLFLSAGGGMSYEILKGINFSTVIMYNNGIFDVYEDDENDNYITELKLKNHFIAINFGLHIDF